MHQNYTHLTGITGSGLIRPQWNPAATLTEISTLRDVH